MAVQFLLNSFVSVIQKIIQHLLVFIKCFMWHFLLSIEKIKVFTHRHTHTHIHIWHYKNIGQIRIIFHKYFFVITDETHNLYTLFCQENAESNFTISKSCLHSFHSEAPSASRSSNTVPVAHTLQNHVIIVFIEIYLV